jgi:hypothetical protein
VPRLNQAAAVPDLADFDCRKANAFHKSRDSRTRILMVARDDPVGRHRRAWAGAILERQLIEGLDKIRARPAPIDLGCEASLVFRPLHFRRQQEAVRHVEDDLA